MSTLLLTFIDLTFHCIIIMSVGTAVGSQFYIGCSYNDHTKVHDVIDLKIALNEAIQGTLNRILFCSKFSFSQN